MNASGSSLWPTAQAFDANNLDRSPEARARAMQKGGCSNLREVAGLWPTSMAGTLAQNGNSAAGNSDFSRKADALWQTIVADDRMDREAGKVNSRGEPKLSGQVMLWAPPAGSLMGYDNDPEGWAARGDRLAEKGLPRQGVNLGQQAQVAHGFLSPLPAPRTATDGRACWTPRRRWRRLWRYLRSTYGSAVARRLASRALKRRLNPIFVEWLMAWPPGHALSGSSETEFTLWRRRMRGALSRLPTASGPWIWEETEMREADQGDLFGGQP